MRTSRLLVTVGALRGQSVQYHTKSFYQALPTRGSKITHSHNVIDAHEGLLPSTTTSFVGFTLMHGVLHNGYVTHAVRITKKIGPLSFQVYI